MRRVRLLVIAVAALSVRRISVSGVWAVIALLAATSALIFDGPSALADHQCLGQSSTIHGTEGNDVINGTGGNDVIQALGGDDTIDGSYGWDIICASDGDDIIDGGEQPDTIVPGPGDDTVDDSGTSPADQDTLSFELAPGPVTADLRGDPNLEPWTATGEGTDTIQGIEILIGSDFNDTLYGPGYWVSSTLLFGGNGDDTLTGSCCNAFLDGGPGSDTLRGANGNDTLQGQEGDDFLDGSLGFDSLDGGPDTDTCDPDPGQDILVRCEVFPPSPAHVEPTFSSCGGTCLEVLLTVVNDSGPPVGFAGIGGSTIGVTGPAPVLLAGGWENVSGKGGPIVCGGVEVGGSGGGGFAASSLEFAVDAGEALPFQVQQVVPDPSFVPSPECPTRWFSTNWTLSTWSAPPFLDSVEIENGEFLISDTDGDGYFDPIDNCPDAYNVFQQDADSDGLGDPCDPDDDNDGTLDITDSCPTAEDLDGYQDSDGCPDPDNDSDGVCDPGLTAASCANPAVTTPPYPSGGSPDRCPNVAEDYDAFLDLDGCPEPDNDGDSFPDATDQCPATDASMGPDGLFQTADDSAFPDPREDFDGTLDTDGCHDSPGDDFDGDSGASTAVQNSGPCPTGGNAWPVFRDCIETFMGTDPAKPCAQTITHNDESPDPWPPDADDDRDVDIADVLALFYGKLGNPPNYTQRSDFDADGDIDVGDLLGAMFGRIGTSCAA